MPKVIGKVLFITDKVNLTPAKETQWWRQSIGLSSFVEVNGNEYEELIKCQVTGDKTDLLNTVNVGDEVEIKYKKEGRIFNLKPEVAKTDKNPRHIDIITNFDLTDLIVVKRHVGVANTTSSISNPVVDDLESDPPF